MEIVLNKIKDFAAKCHGDQIRRYSKDPYVVHPIRVMNTCKEYTHNITVLVAALLHDVLEDTVTSKDEIYDFLKTVLTETEANKTLQLVIELTDVYVKGDYPNWNRRKRKDKEAERLEQTSPEAQTIKYADIIDNAPEITQHDPVFAKRFLQEYKVLLKRISKGNSTLYNMAVETVYGCIEELRVRH